MLVASANEMVFLFVGLELVSLPTYLLLYLPKRNVVTQEAATKYFYLSVFSSGLLLFGLAYLYGLTGISNLKALSYLIHWQDGALNLPSPMFATIALVFVMAGLGFRVAAVPFHFYAPDVYQGSPTVLAALLAWIPKAVGFLAMIRALTALFGFEPIAGGSSNLALVSDKAVLLAWVIAVVTMTLGNTVALAQENLKRLLAYSSIAHAGYLMIGVTVAFRNGPAGTEATLGSDAVIFYLATYALMTLGAFGVILILSTRERPVENVDDLAGLMYTRPWPALAMALCLFSLAGIPPLAGFMGKLRLFTAAWEVARSGDTKFFELLLVLGVLNAAVGAYYYLRIIVVMTFREPTETLSARAGWPAQLAIGACASLSLILGLLPDPLAVASRESGVAAVENPQPSLPVIDEESEMARSETVKAL
ncbi:MAG TPA: NADH-quinone oxidoreductase subunit N, partial [Isosphaeraceae bacterium]|nr:NADH-quinone oxidoreductase subunit N [Isosphaeraceae bacterium]